MLHTARAAEAPDFIIEFADCTITPQMLEAPAGRPFKLELRNTGTSPVELESLELRKEKVRGPGVTSMLTPAARCLGRWRAARFHHLAQALIPLAGVFLGLSSITVNQPRSDGILPPFVGEARGALLVPASLWSAVRARRIARPSALPALQC